MLLDCRHAQHPAYERTAVARLLRGPRRMGMTLKTLPGLSRQSSYVISASWSVGNRRVLAATGCSRCASLLDLVARLYPCECVIYLWLFLLVCTINCFSLLGSLVMAAKDLQWASQMRRTF